MPRPEPDHRREALDQDREREEPREKCRDARARARSRGCRRRAAGPGRTTLPKASSSRSSVRGRTLSLRGARVGGAGAPQVEVEGRLARPAEPGVRSASGAAGRSESRSSPAGAGSRSSTGSEPASRPTTTRKPPLRPTKSGSRVSSEESVPATPGTLAHRRDDRLQRLAALGRLRAGNALDDEEDPVGERRPEAPLEIEADRLRLPGRHPRGDLEPVLDVARRRGRGPGATTPQRRTIGQRCAPRGRPAQQAARTPGPGSVATPARADEFVDTPGCRRPGMSTKHAPPLLVSRKSSHASEKRGRKAVPSVLPRSGRCGWPNSGGGRVDGRVTALAAPRGLIVPVALSRKVDGVLESSVSRVHARSSRWKHCWQTSARHRRPSGKRTVSCRDPSREVRMAKKTSVRRARRKSQASPQTGLVGRGGKCPPSRATRRRPRSGRGRPNWRGRPDFARTFAATSASSERVSPD